MRFLVERASVSFGQPIDEAFVDTLVAGDIGGREIQQGWFIVINHLSELDELYRKYGRLIYYHGHDGIPTISIDDEE